jgi:Na+/H+ antiporter NhaD/arsenite permease-like protein
LPLYTVAPFVTMLLAIALLPLWLPRWWESTRSKLIVSLGLGLPILALYAVRQPEALLSMAEEYVSFIVLLAGLFVISGGILLRGDLVATPLTNTAFLALGSALASFIGTTGARCSDPPNPPDEPRAPVSATRSSSSSSSCPTSAGC